MRHGLFYAKLAWINMKKNRKTYLPYLLTCIGTIMVFFIILSLGQSRALQEMPGGAVMATILRLGTIIVGFFSVLFLFYTNSFLVKRRKKEFGLYYILGMEKRHISVIMLWEMLYTAAVSLSLGVAFGFLFCKLAFLVLLKLLHMEAVMGVEFHPEVMLASIILFGGIFLMTLLNSIRQVYRVRPVELLKGDHVGEKEPKTRWIMAIVGTIALIAGYYLAVSPKDVLTGITQFFQAVLLVITATFCLFTAGSIACLKFLRRKKNYYYKANHFIAVSGMIYRMKQNAASLASICVMSTGVILVLSSTVSLYIGEEDMLYQRYAREFDLVVTVPEGMEHIRDEVDWQMDSLLEKEGIPVENKIQYAKTEFSAKEKDGTFELDQSITDLESLRILFCMELDDYNAMTGAKEKLDEGEALVYCSSGGYEQNKAMIGSVTLKLRKAQNGNKLVMDEGAAYMMPVYFVIVRDKETMKSLQQAAGSYLEYHYAFDTGGSPGQQKEWYNRLGQQLQKSEIQGRMRGREDARQNFYVIYGGLFFIGIFLGLLFLMATVLIIYYKQISEGYDDKERFVIMQKIGMGREEVAKAIHSQVLMVFFLPLLTAGIHTCFAFSLVKLILQGGFGLTNITLLAVCTVGTFLIFGVFYIIVYLVTAKEYYKVAVGES